MITIEETRDLAACHALRRAVFITEQRISEADEMDDKDSEALHLLATLDGAHVGTARLLFAGDVGKIGRVCVLRAHRGHGIGVALIRAGIDRLRAYPEVKTARLGAQEHAIGFYEKLGFVAHGPFYDDAGIDHRDMDYPL